jgi:nucleotide-binding universal stress UspA family protein
VADDPVERGRDRRRCDHLRLAGSRGHRALAARIHVDERAASRDAPRARGSAGGRAGRGTGDDRVRRLARCACRGDCGRPPTAARAGPRRAVWYSAIRHTLAGRALAHGPLDDLRSFADDYEQAFAALAESVVEEGVGLAREADLAATGRAVESHAGAWRALAETAAGENAAVIVCGSRGRGAVAATVLGSTSSGLVHNADSPVLVVRPHAESGKA